MILHIYVYSNGLLLKSIRSSWRHTCFMLTVQLTFKSMVNNNEMYFKTFSMFIDILLIIFNVGTPAFVNVRKTTFLYQLVNVKQTWWTCRWACNSIHGLTYVFKSGLSKKKQFIAWFYIVYWGLLFSKT